MQKLSAELISHQMETISGWRLDGEAIKKEWKFRDFKEAMKFINRIGDLAEAHDHHPEIFNVYNQVSLRFNTHDAGGLTDRDFKIAAEIDRLKL